MSWAKYSPENVTSNSIACHKEAENSVSRCLEIRNQRPHVIIKVFLDKSIIENLTEKICT